MNNYVTSYYKQINNKLTNSQIQFYMNKSQFKINLKMKMNSYKYKYKLINNSIHNNNNKLYENKSKVFLQILNNKQILMKMKIYN